jgi:hypothetical protein
MQLAAKHKWVLEDLGEDVVLSSTDRFNQVKGSPKCSQLEEDAMHKVLDVVMEGPDCGKDPWEHGDILGEPVRVAPGHVCIVKGCVEDVYVLCRAGGQ